MGFEPRMRGRRFGRPAAKKKSAKDRREQREGSMFYEEATPIDPSRICSNTLNALEHLGSQRFALPPYSEHFQRWMKDIARLLSGFESQLPEAADQQYKGSVEKRLSDLQVALKERSEREANISSRIADEQRRLATSESELMKLDQGYKNRAHEVRRQYEKSFEILGSEIEKLDKERLRILHTKPSLFQRLFRKSELSFEDKANTLRSKKNDLDKRKEALKQELEEQRLEYENKRKQITEQLGALRAELEESGGSRLDDALEIRMAACGDFCRIVNEAVDRWLKQRDSLAAQEKT